MEDALKKQKKQGELQESDKPRILKKTACEGGHEMDVENTPEDQGIEVEEELENAESEKDEKMMDEDLLDKLKKELKQKTIEAEDYFNSLRRLQADFQNYKKRVAKEKQNIYKYASEGLIIKFLPILDNFERAMDSIKDKKDKEEGENEFKSFIQGVDMILKQFKQVLEEEGVKEIQAVGENFDPNYHEAVEQVADERYQSDTIISVVRKGYIYKDKVIRPSLVKVVK